MQDGLLFDQVWFDLSERYAVFKCLHWTVTNHNYTCVCGWIFTCHVWPHGKLLPPWARIRDTYQCANIFKATSLLWSMSPAWQASVFLLQHHPRWTMEKIEVKDNFVNICCLCISLDKCVCICLFKRVCACQLRCLIWASRWGDHGFWNSLSFSLKVTSCWGLSVSAFYGVSGAGEVV